MNKKTADRLFIIMFIMLFIFMIATTYLIIYYSEELKSNPLIYGAKRFFGNIECTCMKYDSNGDLKGYFAFNSSTMWDLKNNDNNDIMFINSKELNVSSLQSLTPSSLQISKTNS
jgi:hypothetical protein